MRSRLKAIAVLLLLTVLPIRAAPVGQAPSRADIQHALEAVKTDPNLAPEKTIRTLKWVRTSDPEPDRPTGSLQWLVELMSWFAQSARVVVWVAVALVAGLLVVFVLRLLKERSPTMGPRRMAIPTHVQDLDIRPESLPDNIGAAARELWDSGDHRASLSLLYRGLLSRLVHVHNVPIRDSSTEGDTLQLTATRLRDEKQDYVSRLIRIWQHAVYGGQQPEAEAIYVLCDEFAPALDPAP
ncbi:MAG: DUF4129 domain-containing protein [Proteobacteria bacterium]|nr:DUF4129 domain-containing protein [Pseudomonadota bacterium]